MFAYVSVPQMGHVTYKDLLHHIDNSVIYDSIQTSGDPIVNVLTHVPQTDVL